MTTESPDYIRIEGALYKRVPDEEPGEVRTAQSFQQHLQAFQNVAEGLSGALTKLEQAAPLIQQKVTALKGPLENANKAAMGKQFPQAMQILQALKPQVADFKSGVADIVLPLIQGISEKFTPEAIDGLVQDINTLSALASAEGAGMALPGTQTTAPQAPAGSGVAATPPPPAAPAQAPPAAPAAQ
jgi:hypothetical protein